MARPACALVALVLAGCAAHAPSPTRGQLAEARIGPPPDRYEARVKDYFASHLRDPHSAVYTVDRPVRAWEDGSIVWAVCGTINARNAFGWYFGPRPFVAFFLDSDRMLGMIDRYRYTDSPFVEKCAAWHAVGVYE